MNLSLPLFHFETWASFAFSLVGLAFLVYGFVRTRMFAFLSLAIGNVIFAIQLFVHYAFWLGRVQPQVGLQLAMTAMFLVASIFSTVGMAILCVRVATRASNQAMERTADRRTPPLLR